MKNRWDEDRLNQIGNDPVELRVLTSNLLGEEEDLVLHGGGNTSVKGELETIFGEKEKVLFVKGSGWDLRTIKAAGFPPVKLEYLLRLGELEALSDSEMMRQLRLALLDPQGPTPSVEAILHALIPHRFVDHSHADAVVAISNTPNGEEHLKQIYGDEVLILPYIMPGFILARQVAEATRSLDWSTLKGIILLHHGIFTFHEDAKTSYENMIELVGRAEEFLASNTDASTVAKRDYACTNEDCLQLAQLRKAAGAMFGNPVLVRMDNSVEATGFAALANVADLATRGPLTPDHTIHAKAFAAIFENDPAAELIDFEQAYRDYFEEHAMEEHQCLDTMPRYAVWKNKGMVYLAGNRKRLEIVKDITQHTVRAIQQGEALGAWQALPKSDLFDVEYWELEQAKLKSGAKRAEFEGKVAVVTGAASGIGAACVEELIGRGAAVIALDIDENLDNKFADASVLKIHCDVTDGDSIKTTLMQGVQHFGGIDILISNAGNFPNSQNIDAMDDGNWEKSLELNLSSHMRVMRACLPFLKEGFDPAIVIVASKNVPAPGPGAAAYSTAKAGLTQMARVAALELGVEGIRVNVLHPNAVYDTAIWTEEVLAARAERYGISVEEYKTSNVLKTEVRSIDVARAVALFAGDSLAKTTGSQLAIDGGNERVI
ncbi:MAG: bifunctional aldolase/short-chain dehydrogenase [Gammaproteobacteria bacterium]|nr:bifunctional aldolase/short-chain dehydrogenase [Gammaproteobacteria bacterium]